jgi:hypothetical protein
VEVVPTSTLQWLRVKFQGAASQGTARWFSIFVDLAVPTDPREHDAPQVAFQQSVRLGQGIIEPGAFFKFVSIHVGLGQHLLGGPAALGPHRIKFKNNSRCPANGQFDVLLTLSHANRIALQSVPRYVTKS